MELQKGFLLSPFKLKDLGEAFGREENPAHSFGGQCECREVA